MTEPQAKKFDSALVEISTRSLIRFGGVFAATFTLVMGTLGFLATHLFFPRNAGDVLEQKVVQVSASLNEIRLRQDALGLSLQSVTSQLVKVVTTVDRLDVEQARRAPLVDRWLAMSEGLQYAIEQLQKNQVNVGRSIDRVLDRLDRLEGKRSDRELLPAKPAIQKPVAGVNP